MRSNLVDIKVIVVRDHPNDNAILVKLDEDAKPVWLPRSMVEITEPDKNSIVTATMTEAFATDKGLT